jgi:hypothetical protein
LLVLAALLVVRVWIPPTFEGIDPERLISARNKAILKNESFDAGETYSRNNNP